ncbi:MAG: ABC transporter substrate-binding protein [Bacteroidales bacterium]
MRNLIVCFISVLFFVACRGGAVGSGADVALASANSYAKGFTVSVNDGYTVVDVINPWDTLKVLHRYVLVPKSASLPDSLPEGTLLRTPLKRVAVYAALHCGVIKELGVIDNVVGICDAYYVADTMIKARISSGKIANLGDSFVPDIEKIIELQPEAVILSPYRDGSYGKVSQLGVPLVEFADYMENTPLSRTEWIKFMGLLFGKEYEADSVFIDTERRYKELAKIGSCVKIRPTLFAEMKTGSVWYQPGGGSYMAALYNDAGINYLWRERSETGSVALSFEEVLERAAHADLWIFKYGRENENMTLSLLKEEFAPYSNFDAFKKGNVWGCNGLKVSFYEDLPVHPDRALRDLLMIAHPELFSKNDTTLYFKHLAK